jgi:MspA
VARTAVLSGPEDARPPEGALEVGYQIGCGIDMSTSNGVTLTGSVGMTPSVGLGGIDVVSPLPEGLVPAVLTPVSGGMAIALKPGLVNVVPVSKKQFRGFEPRRVPHQDRRLRGRILHPLILVPDPLDGSVGRRHGVVRRNFGLAHPRERPRLHTDTPRSHGI